MNKQRMYNVLRTVVESEKSAMAAESGQYVFKVDKTATKLEIKNAVEQIFETKVANVNVLNVKGKSKRTRYGLGVRNDWRKAYIRLEEGLELDFSKAGVTGA